MDEFRDYCNNGSKSNRERYDITYVCNLNHDTDELISATETDRELQCLYGEALDLKLFHLQRCWLDYINSRLEARVFPFENAQPSSE